MENKIAGNFRYWFKHWKAFQKTAISLHHWRLRFLFHDIEKPFFQMIFSHKIVSRWHRRFHRHHPEYIFPFLRDYTAMIIDWQCAASTKPDKPLDVLDTLNKYYSELRNRIIPILIKLGLYGGCLYGGKMYRSCDLWDYVKGMKPVREKISDICDFKEITGMFANTRTYGSIHSELYSIVHASLRYPIIIYKPAGIIADGNHRILKAIMKGKKYINVIYIDRFPDKYTILK